MKKNYATYYATTEIWQGDILFKNTWDFTGNQTNRNAIKHLTAIFDEVKFDSLEASGEGLNRGQDRRRTRKR